MIISPHSGMKYANLNENGIEATTKKKKKNLRHIFVDKRNNFDKNCQQTKRQYWYRSQDELLNIQNKDPREFWKNVGKIGVGSERQKSIPMEVILEDGSICTDTNIILNTWKTSYEHLLNCDDVVKKTS